AHQVWEVDAKERIPLASGQRVRWLAFTDEASGALLATELSPPRALGEGPSGRDPGDVSSGLHPLGIAPSDPGRQWLSLGDAARPVHGVGPVADRVGPGGDLESARTAAGEPQGRALPG